MSTAAIIFEKSEKGIVRLHLKRKTERNPTIALLCMQADDCVSQWHRHLKHIGVNRGSELRRRMTKEEFTRESKCTRLHSHAYRSWVALIRDEWVNTFDTDWCTSIIEVAGLKWNLEEILNPKLSHERTA